MKKILICDDDIGVLKKIKVDATGIPVELIFIDTLAKLLICAKAGVPFEAVFLDGFLGDNTTTTPFLENLISGQYPHLEKTCFYFMSSDMTLKGKQLCMCKRQIRVFEEVQGYDEEDIKKWISASPDMGKIPETTIPPSVRRKKIMIESYTTEDLFTSSPCEKDTVVEKIKELL